MPNCPHCEHELTAQEVGVLYAAAVRTQKGPSRRWGVKLTRQDVSRIRRSKKPIKELAALHNVSFQTIWRAKVKQTYAGTTKLNCPHCGHKLTRKKISRLFASIGGSTFSPKKAQHLDKMRQAIAKTRNAPKLTEEDIADIRNSNASTRELARKYEVRLITIRRIRRNEIYKPIQSK